MVELSVFCEYNVENTLQYPSILLTTTPYPDMIIVALLGAAFISASNGKTFITFEIWKIL